MSQFPGSQPHPISSCRSCPPPAPPAGPIASSEGPQGGPSRCQVFATCYLTGENAEVTVGHRQAVGRARSPGPPTLPSPRQEGCPTPLQAGLAGLPHRERVPFLARAATLHPEALGLHTGSLELPAAGPPHGGICRPPALRLPARPHAAWLRLPAGPLPGAGRGGALSQFRQPGLPVTASPAVCAAF